MKSICIFAGSSDFAIEPYRDEVERLTEYFVSRGVSIVYGAGRVGLMGVVSEKAFALGGTLIGVVPKYFNSSELVFDGCSELIVTADLQERKAVMANKAEAFIVLPGGIGTLDEFAEVLAWKQARQHMKPIFLLNLNSFYEPLLAFFKRMLESHFIYQHHLELFEVFNSVREFIVFVEKRFFSKIEFLNSKEDGQ